MTDQIVCCVILAAGAGSRFHDVGHKLLAALPTTPDRPAERVIDRTVAAAVDADAGPVAVVTGRLDGDDLGLDADVVDIVHNPQWSAGQATSVQAAVAHARGHGADAVVIGLADQPGVTPSAWRNVADATRRGAKIAVATYDGRRGNPVGLHRDVWHLLATSGDEGARTLMRIREELVEPVSCDGQPDDIDTVEDLHQWQSN